MTTSQERKNAVRLGRMSLCKHKALGKVPWKGLLTAPNRPATALKLTPGEAKAADEKRPYSLPPKPRMRMLPS